MWCAHGSTSGSMGVMSDKYYYCLVHKTVEGEDGCRATDRLGPYDSQSAASHALETAAERTKAWDNDPDWNDNAAPDKPTE